MGISHLAAAGAISLAVAIIVFCGVTVGLSSGCISALLTPPINESVTPVRVVAMGLVDTERYWILQSGTGTSARQ